MMGLPVTKEQVEETWVEYIETIATEVAHVTDYENRLADAKAAYVDLRQQYLYEATNRTMPSLD
jgi:hypothetical protein